MSSSARLFAILNLFTGEHPTWHADDINATLGYPRATGYRSVRELVEAGFLQKVEAGRYALGARIIELDFQLRRSDPVLLAAAPVMEQLSRQSGLDAVLSSIYGEQVIDTHRATQGRGPELAYGRGRPRPLLQGAAPKVLLAHLPRAQQQRIYQAHAGAIAAHGMGAGWEEFRTVLAEVRRNGCYLSRGELEPALGALALPLRNGEQQVLAALAVVGPLVAIDSGAATLTGLLQKAAARIEARLLAPQG